MSVFRRSKNTRRLLLTLGDPLQFTTLPALLSLLQQITMTTKVDDVDRQAFLEILLSRRSYETKEDKEACQKLVEALTPEDQETAAQASHAYWVATVLDDSILKEASSSSSSLSRESLRTEFAMREARRHWIGEQRHFEKAQSALQKALALRKEHRVDLVRLAGEAENLENNSQFTKEEKETVHRYRLLLEEELGTQLTLVGGLDKDQRAVALRFSRTKADTNVEAYLVAQMYIAERATAATEFYSRGLHEKVVAIAEYKDYSSTNAPPMLSLREMIATLQQLYPERLFKMVMTDPPFWMRTLYNILYPLLAKKTTEKMVMTTGKEQKQEALEQLIDNVAQYVPCVDVEKDWDISQEGVNLQVYLNQPMYKVYTDNDRGN